MSELATVGIDLAKSVFQIHGVSRNGHVVVRRQLRRNQLLAFFVKQSRCLIGMEACAGAHDWGRRLQAMGHDVRLMPPAYVKPYVKRGKTDAAGAAAICEAVTRPSKRFVAVKSEDCSAVLLSTARETNWFVSARRSAMRSGPIWRSSVSSWPAPRALPHPTQAARERL